MLANGCCRANCQYLLCDCITVCVAGWLQQVRESLDEAGRLEVMQQLLEQVPARFWPDVNGQFGRD